MLNWKVLEKGAILILIIGILIIDFTIIEKEKIEIKQIRLDFIEGSEATNERPNEPRILQTIIEEAV